MEIKDIIQTKFNEYNEYMTKINKHLTLLENRINLLENQLKNKVEKNENQITNDDNIVELKKELLDIDNETIKKAIIYRDYRSILYLFKIHYKKKTNEKYQYPIRIKSKRVYEYYNNKQWIADNYGHYIKNTLFMNIQTCFYKYNNLDNLTDVDDIYNNQIFINKLSDDKYKRDIFRHIVDEIQNT